jgi:hypothetical protein
MKYLIFIFAVRIARWACKTGDTYDWLEKAEKRETTYHYWAKLND